MPYRPVLLRPRDIAVLLGRPESTVKRWAHEGRVTSYNGMYDWLEFIDVVEGRATVPPRKTTAAAA